MEPMHSRLSLRLCAALAIGSVTGACGAKTELRVWDSSVRDDVALDVPSVIDATDVRDAIEPEEAAVCIPGRFLLERRGAEILFVVDRSTSMAYSLDGAPNPEMLGQPTRWQVLRDALRTVLPPFERTVAFGAKFFPQVITEANRTDINALCSSLPGVDLEPALNNGNAILAFFARTAPAGGTPTFQALEQAIGYLRTRAGRGTARYIVLATDGGPNCNGMNPIPPGRCVCTALPQSCLSDSMFGIYNCLDADRTIALIRETATPSTPGTTPIPIFVIGIDGSMTDRPDLLAVLDEMAVAGGRPRPIMNPGDHRYYSVRAPRDLDGAFQSIVAPLARCAFVTPSRPDNPDEIDIEVNGRTIPRDVTRVDGWDWTDPLFGEITLFGTACTEASAPQAQVRARVGCRDR